VSIQLSTFSQSVTVIREDSVCFDIETASKIMNDIDFMEQIIIQKSDSINALKYDTEACYVLKTEQEKKLQNKNTGLWIQGGVNLILGILTLIFAN
jgi:hypothetical protein